MEQSNIGILGLAVMGENLAINMESKGFTVSVFNRTTEKVTKFINGRAQGKNIRGAYSLEELVSQLEKPRKVMIMVKAGQPVDDMIEQLIPLMEPGDVIIDGGNSNFHDTIRRTAYVESKGLLYVGTGVSGGEEGALHGPSMMPGVRRRPGRWSSLFFRRSARRWRTGLPAANGSVPTGQDIMSKWSITALNMAICS